MALDTLDRSPPPFFRVGLAPLTKLIFFSALSLLLMFGDKQLQFTKPLRAGLSTLVLPVQWLVLQPVLKLRLKQLAAALLNLKV